MAKASSVANRIIERHHQKHGENITLTKLQKLAYYTQGWYLAVFNAPLFEDEIQALSFGPTVASLHHRFKYLSGHNIPIDNQYASVGYEDLTPDQITMIDKVVDRYGEFSEEKLVNLTRKKGTPWANHRAAGNTRLVMSFESISKYFKQFN